MSSISVLQDAQARYEAQVAVGRGLLGQVLAQAQSEPV